ncbi:MAG TPA: hypothetical protein ENK19_06890 [Acidobacteria bacterium]|nr:hypothetical protein [Acidobacteriota bacterium]
MMKLRSLVVVLVALAVVVWGAPASGGQAGVRPDGAGGASVRSLAVGMDRTSSGLKGHVLHWLGHSGFLHGALDADLVGEAGLRPVCGGQPISQEPGAPVLEWSYHSTGVVESTSDEVALDLDTCGRDYTSLLRYYETQIWTETPRSVRMLVSADGGVRVWLNGQEVITEYGPAAYEEDQYHADVDLQAGWNFLVVKQYLADLTPAGGGEPARARWSMRFVDPDGGAPVDVAQAVDGWCSPGESPTGWVFFNSAAHLKGVRSTWRSNLRLTNPYAVPLRVVVVYRPEGSVTEAGSQDAPVRAASTRRTSGPATRTFILGAYQTETLDDLVPAMGVSGDQKGMLAVGGFDATDGKTKDVVNLRTFNQTSDGTFGTTIPPMRAGDGVDHGRQVFLGLRNGPAFRTNLACTPLSALDDTIRFTVTIWDQQSGTLRSKTFTGQGYFQINDVFRQLGLAKLTTDSAVLGVRFDPSPDHGKWVFTATVNDNRTSDPVFVSPGYAIPLPSGS